MPLKPRLCVRLPGGGITRRLQPVERFYEREYREFGIDPIIIHGILDVLSGLASEFIIVLIPSGAGAFLLSDLARRLGLSSDEVTDVSISVVTAQAKIVHRWLARRLRNGSAIVRSPTHIMPAAANTDACVVLPSGDYQSTDALWAASAYESSASAAFNFKRLTPSTHIVQDALKAPLELSRQWLIQNAVMWARADASPIFDTQAISYCAHMHCDAWLLQPEYPNDMRRILAGKLPQGVSRRISRT
jgi:hypothetical protein